VTPLNSANERADCGVRALAVACLCSYEDAYAALESAGRKACGKTWDKQLIKAAKTLGYKLTLHNAAGTIANVKRELPTGRWIAHSANHYIGIDNGEAVDHSVGTRRRIKYAFKAERIGS
jgi:hypothetical protein